MVTKNRPGDHHRNGPGNPGKREAPGNPGNPDNEAGAGYTTVNDAGESTRNVFVIGLDEANLPALRRAGEGRCTFHALLTPEELQSGEVSVAALRSQAEKALDSFPGRIDAIVGYWDFPVSTLLPLLAERYGTRGTSLESVVKCEHKYWSRLEQSKVTDAIPDFGIVDLEAENPVPPDGVGFPMWLKPALAYSSELAFGVSDLREFREAVELIRAGVDRVGRPFEYILSRVELPPEMASVGGSVCLAEEQLSGVQVAVEGFVHRGQVTVNGVLDSIQYPDSPCFLRHQYPSGLPEPVQERLRDVSRRVIGQVGLDGVTFSIEYFYDPSTDRIGLLEINPRHSQSHALLFEYVDGLPNHSRMLRLAHGEDPFLPSQKGPYAMAAKWYYLSFTDSSVHDIPDAAQLSRIEKENPGVRIQIPVDEGDRLSGLEGQDSYSYDVAHIFTAADSEAELREKYDRAIAALGLRIKAVEGDGA